MKYPSKITIPFLVLASVLIGAASCNTKPDASSREAASVNQQQEQFAVAQPVPKMDYSLERDLLIQLYLKRNTAVTTYSLWRGNTSIIEDHCPSIGYGMPFDVSLTNPLALKYKITNNQKVTGVVEQPEPNGVFASKNTNATWVFCLNADGSIEPEYVEAKVTVYAGPIEVDMDTNRVKRVGPAAVTLTLPKKGGN
jgi:hypothetical protein